MPNITVELFAGRSLDQKRAFVKAVAQACVEILNAKPETVRIRFLEMTKEDLARGDTLVCDLEQE